MCVCVCVYVMCVCIYYVCVCVYTHTHTHTHTHTYLYIAQQLPQFLRIQVCQKSKETCYYIKRDLHVGRERPTTHSLTHSRVCVCVCVIHTYIHTHTQAYQCGLSVGSRIARTRQVILELENSAFQILVFSRRSRLPLLRHPPRDLLLRRRTCASDPRRDLYKTRKNGERDLRLWPSQRDLRLWPKKPTPMAKETYAYIAKETYAYIAKETYAYRQRDLAQLGLQPRNLLFLERVQLRGDVFGVRVRVVVRMRISSLEQVVVRLRGVCAYCREAVLRNDVLVLADDV